MNVATCLRRRAVLRVLLALSALAVAAARSPLVAGARHPNLVVIMLDDLDATTTPYTQAMPKTERLLAGNGMTFTNAFAPTPTCCPARTQLLTGRYGHNSGVLSNLSPTGGFQAFQANGNEGRSIARTLDTAGYHTALFGKYLNGYSSAPLHVPEGWDDWYGAADDAFYFGYDYKLNENGVLRSYGMRAVDYATDVIRDKAVAVIRQQEADDARPMFLYLNPTAPHRFLKPAPRHTDHPWAAASVPRRPNFYEGDLSDKPSWLRTSAPVRDTFRSSMDQDHRDRMGTLLAVDDLVARVMSELGNHGELANTYVILVSDNGYNLGAHHLADKTAPYDESIRVVLMVFGPNVVRGRQDRLVIMPDLAPTLLHLAGITPPASMDGRSLAPLLFGQSPTRSAWRKDFLVEYAPAPPPGSTREQAFTHAVLRDVPTYRGVRGRDYLYVQWYAERDPVPHEYEFYDLNADPYQLNNLAATPEQRAAIAPLLKTLQARLEQLSVCAGTTCRS